MLAAQPSTASERCRAHRWPREALARSGPLVPPTPPHPPQGRSTCVSETRGAREARAAPQREKVAVGDVSRLDAGREAVCAHRPSGGAPRLCGLRGRPGDAKCRTGEARLCWDGQCPASAALLSPEATTLSPLEPGTGGVIGC